MMKADNLKLTFNAGTPIENPALRGMSLHIKDGEFAYRYRQQWRRQIHIFKRD